MEFINKNQVRSIRDIAIEIKNDWGDKIYFGAVPYLNAMLKLHDVNDNYGLDSADTIIRYFRSNSTRYSGETARRVKKELDLMIKNE